MRAIRNLRDEARDFRLISSSLAADPKARSRESDEERLAVGAVQAIHDTIYFTIDLLKKSLDLNTCVLLWLDDAGERLKIKELVTDSDCVVETAINADAGALGTVVKNRLLVNLRDPKRGHLPYYAAPVEVSFLGVPVMEDGHLRGVLCADRGGDRPFNDREEKLLQAAAEQMLRGIQSERVFAAVERAKYEHERFFAALARLNRALTAEEVYSTTFEATREICDFDFAAITLFDKGQKRHTVVSAVGEAPQGAGRPVLRRQRRHRLDGGQEQALPARRRRNPRQGRARLHQEGAPRRHGVAARAAAHQPRRGGRLLRRRRQARRARSARTSARCSRSSPTTSASSCRTRSSTAAWRRWPPPTA